MWIREPWPGEILHLCRAMREMDAREILDMRPTRDPDLFAATILTALPRATIAAVAGLDSAGPAAAFLGIWPDDSYPWQAQAALFATDEFPRIAAPLIRFIRRTVIPALLASGVHRVECRALEAHAQARRFLRACRAVEEIVLPDYGRNRESYVLCAWRRSDWENADVLPASAEAAGEHHRQPVASGERGG